MDAVLSITDPAVAAHLLDPLRARILAQAREPLSASQIAERVGMQRQRVNYHVRTLAKAGLLKESGRRERRNLTEVLYIASAARYLVDPAALGPLAPAPDQVGDRTSTAYALAVGARSQHELGEAQKDGAAEGRAATASVLDIEVRFGNASEREAFARSLQDAAASLATRLGAQRGRAHRFVGLVHARSKAE